MIYQKTFSKLICVINKAWRVNVSSIPNTVSPWQVVTYQFPPIVPGVAAAGWVSVDYVV